MMKGRKPKPSAIHKRDGTWRRDRMNENEPRFTPGLPEPPSHLQPAALTAWHRLCKELESAGVLTTADMELVAMLAQEWVRLAEAEKHLAEEGPIVANLRGTAMVSPYLNIVRGCTRTVLALLTELGLTPSARCRLRPAPGSKADDEAYFEDGGS